VDAFRAHERVKSATVDTVRYAHLFARGGLPPEQLAASLTANLNAARPAWDISAPIKVSAWSRPQT